jgi:hypothetical protein
MPIKKEIITAAYEIFESTLLQAKDKLDIIRKESKEGERLLDRFHEFKKYGITNVHKVTEFKGALNSFIILLVEKEFTHVTQTKHGSSRQHIEEVEPVLLFKVPTYVGKVLVTKETISDKFAEIFYKVDIDFEEYPGFSSNYFVVGENPDLVKKYFPPKLMETLNKIPSMIVEIDGMWGLLRAEKNVSESLLLLLISIGYKMTK